jgi:hypothetical protein
VSHISTKYTHDLHVRTSIIAQYAHSHILAFTHLQVGLQRLDQATVGQEAAMALSKLGIALFSARTLDSMCAAVASHAPAAFFAEAVC